jgi:hypothetical protein
MIGDAAEHQQCSATTAMRVEAIVDGFPATTINAEHAEPAEKNGVVLRVLRFLR